MTTQTYTIAQALATNATGIVVLDSAANIAGALPNAALVARVSVFEMNAVASIAAWQAENLATLGSAFSANGFKLTIRDTVASLTSSAYAAGLVLPGVVIAVYDTAANILAATGNSIIRNASSIALSANATLTLAQLLTLESWPSFTAAGLTLTLADSAANLLALTAAEQKPTLTVFQVAISSSVTASQALTLGAMSHFSVTSGATLTIADTIANLTANASALASVVSLSGVVEVVADTVGNLLSQTTALTTLEAQMPHLTVMLATSSTASVSQLASLAALPGFRAGTGNTLTVADTVQNLLTLTAAQKALIQATTLSGSGTAIASQLVQLAALPAFSHGTGHTLVVTDTLANLAALTAAQTALATSTAVDDTMTNVVAAQAAHSTVLAAASAVTVELDGSFISVAQLSALQTLSGFTLHPNANSSVLTIADSVTDLLNLTAPQKALIQATTLTANSGASALQLGQLAALPAFSRGTGHTLVVTDTLANLGTLTAAQRVLASSSTVDDTVSNILAANTAHSTVLSAASVVTAELDGATVTVAQLGSLLALPGITLHPNVTASTLTVADTVLNLLTLSMAEKSDIQATTLAGNDTANVSQLVQLAALPSFSHGSGHTLTATDTLASLATLTTPQRALATSTAVDDTLSNVLAAENTHSATLSAAAAVTAELDGTTITVAQAQTLLTLPGLRLHANGSNTTLTVADTIQNLATGASTLSMLNADGPVTEQATNNDAILGASAAAALVTAGINPANYVLAVADTGSAISANASQIFGQGFLDITVTSGTFAGSLAQLLDPSLRFLSGAAAELNANASPTAAQAMALAALPSFSVAGGVTVAVQDQIANLVADAATLSHVATSVAVSDAETVSAAGAAALASLQAAVGSAHFSFGTHDTLTIADTAQNILAAGASALALASSIGLSSDAHISESAAVQLAALGGKFSNNGYFVTVSDTAGNLDVLASAPATLALVNGWIGAATLNANGMVTVANAALLLQIDGFNLAGHQLVISDTASNLLNAANASAVALGTSVQLSQNATNITAANLLQLEALPGFSLGGHMLTVEDTANALLSDFQGSNVPFASGVTLAANSGPWVVDASDATRLADMPGFDAGSAGIEILDNASALLSSANAAGLAVASSIFLNAPALVSVSQAEALETLHGFSRNGQSFTISDSETNLATLNAATAALATSIQVQGSPDVTVSQYDALIATQAFVTGGNDVVVADTATNLLALVGQSLTNVSGITLLSSPAVTAAQAQSLSTLANFATGNNLTISDSIAHLVQITGSGTQQDYAAGEALATRVSMNADGTITVAQGALLASLGPDFSNGGYHLVLEDTPTDLQTAGTTLGPIMSQITSTVLASNGATPWSVSIAQAQALSSLPNLSLGVSGGVIADSVANILFGGNASIVDGAPAVTLNANATGNNSVSVAQAEALHALSNFSLGSYQLNILDGIGHLATLDAGTAAMATSIQLQGSGLASVTQFNTIRTLPNYSNNGKLLVISDTAGNLETLSGNMSLASVIMLSTSITNVLAATAEQLASLPNFTTGIAHMAVVDSTTDLVAGSGSLPTDWAGELAATSVTLNALGGAITAAQADELAMLGGRFSTGGNALTVQDTVANMIAAANASGMALATAVTLEQNETLPVATWAQVDAFSNFSKGGHSVTVSDTAAAIAAANATLLTAANAVQLSTAATLTVTAAESLAGLANFQANAAAPITIADTLPNLLLLAGSSNAVLQAASIELSANATAIVAQLAALAALPQYHSFTANGFSITVEDSGANLAAYTADSIAVPSAYVMIGDATLTPAQGNALVTEHVSIGSNHLTIASDPGTLLSLSAGLNTLATGLTLNTASSATVAQATALEEGGRFSTGGYALTVTGSASALLGFESSYPLLATTLALSESGDVIHASDLQNLAELGTRFVLAGHSMTVTDTAAALAALNSFETALAHSEVLDDSETISATTAADLGALPNFSLGGGVTLTVTGTYAQLTALPASIQSIATLELTGAGGSPLTAAQAAALSALANFSPAADVIVQDTIADLTNAMNTGWQRVATGGYVVTDSVSNLLDNIGLALLSSANSVTLLGDAQVDGADFLRLAGMSNFSRGTATLTVQDSATGIATDATEIAALASSALVDSATAVSAADAEALAGLNGLHMLNFAGGVSLAVQDTFATIQSGNYTAGLALAHMITVQGDAADLVSATSFAWPDAAIIDYQLTAGGNIAAATAVTLHGLGGNYLPNGFTLTVADNAQNVVNAATAIQALGLQTAVTDTVAGVDAETTALLALGTTLLSITLTGSGSVHAAAAAELAPLVGKLIGPAIAVSDTAQAVDTSLTALQTLGAHISTITVNDSAADIAPYASALSALGTELLISLTDTTPISVSANVAAGLAPLVSQLAGVTINVSDTGGAIGADAGTLAELTELGTITLSDGTTVSAAVAAELQPIDSHLSADVVLNVADSAAAIAAAAEAIAALSHDGRLGTVTANGQTAAAIATYGATLASLGATATITDSAENVSAHLDALQPFAQDGVLHGITLNDSADIAVSIGQFTSDAGVLALIGGSFKYAITDSSANIAGDLGAGAGSHILTLGAKVDTITVNGGTLSLTAATLLATGVDGALAQLTGGTLIAATNVAVSQFASIDLLAIQPDSFAVADGGTAIGNDLNAGAGGSELLAHLAEISGIAPTGTVAIDYAAAITAHVDDGAGSVLSKMPGATLEVTGVAIGNIAAMLALPVAAATVAVTDTVGDIQGDLGGGSPVLVQYLGQIDTIAASVSGTVTLDADHALAAHVDDNASSVFGKISGVMLDVTGAEVGQLGGLYALYQRPASVAVSDSATHIAGDLQLGAASVLETYVADGFVSAITVQNGPVDLEDSYVVPAIAGALAALPLDSLHVTNVPIANIAAVAGLHAFASMTVQDDVADIAANLAAGSPLVTYAASITGMTITDGPLVLTDAAAKAADSTALSTLPSDSLDVTGVAVGDVLQISGIAALASMTVRDSAANIATDLRLGSLSSELDLQAAKISSVTVNDSGAVAAADAATVAALAAKLTGPAFAVSDTAAAVDAALAGLATLGAHVSTVTVSDSAADVAPYAEALTALGSELVISLTDGTTFTTGAQVAAELAPLAAKLAGSTINVNDSGSDVAQYATTLAGLGALLGTVTLSDGDNTDAATAAGLAPIGNNLGHGVMINVSDSAAAIAGAAGLSTLQSDDRLGTVTSDGQTASDIVTYGNTLASLGATATITDSAENVSANLDALQMFSLPGGLLRGITLNDSADIVVSIGKFTTDANVLGLIGSSFKYAITDSSANIAADLGAGVNSNILGLGAQVDSITVNGGTLSLTAATLLAAGVDAALAQLSGGTLIAATDVSVSQFADIDLLAIQPTTFAVADSGTDIGNDLNAGGGGSELLAHRTSIGSIVPTGTVVIDYAAATTGHVDDGAGSILSKMPGATLEVTGVAIGNIAAMLALPVAAAKVAVSDTNGNVQADLGGSSPTLVQYLSQIDTITTSGTVTLDADHVLAAGVDGNAASVFGKMTGATLDVTGAMVGQLGALYGLYQRPAGVAVSDTAGHIGGDLQLGAGSLLETYAANGFVTDITVQGGPVDLDYSYVVPAIADALAALPLDSLHVTSVPIADIAAVAGMHAFASMTVQDDVADIAANIGAGSPLATYAGSITGMTITDGPLMLTDAAAKAADPTALSTLPSNAVDVTGVAAGDVLQISGIAALATMSVSDTAANISNDLQLGSASSELELHAAKISGITVTSGTVSLTDAQAQQVTDALAKLSVGSLTISGASVADAGTYAATAALASMTVSDTAFDVHRDLIADTSVLQTYAATHVITGITVTDAAVSLTAAQAENVLDALAILGGGHGLTVSGVSVADIPNIGVLGALTGMTVSDTATAILADLVQDTASNLYVYRASITGVTVGSGPVEITAADEASAQYGALALLPADSLLMDGVSVAHVAAAAALPGLIDMTVSDTANAVQTDLASGGAHALETYHAAIDSITVSSGQVTLNYSDASGDMDALALIGTAGALVITGVPVAGVDAVAALDALDHMTVSDSDVDLHGSLAGANSVLEEHAADISAITFSSGGSIALTGTQAALVMDALAKLPESTVTVSNAAADQVSALGALNSVTSMTISDTGSDISGALTAIEANIGKITGISITTGTVELEYTATAAVMSALAALPAGKLTVDDVPFADIGAIAGLGSALYTMTVSSDGATISGDLAQGATSVIETNIGVISEISVSSGTVSLTDAEADAVPGALAVLQSGSTTITAVPVGSDMTTFYNLAAVAGMTVSDTAANVQSDLISGGLIEAAAGKINSISVSGGTVALTDAEATAVLAALAKLPASSLTVSAVPVSDVAAIGALTALSTMAVHDSGDAVSTNLGNGASSSIYAARGKISGITLSTGSVSLSDAAADAVYAALALLPNGSLGVTGVPLSDLAHIAGLGATLSGIAVADTAALIQAALAPASVIVTNAAAITGITPSGTVTLSDAAADAVIGVLGKLSAESLVVTGVAVNDIVNIAPLASLAHMTVLDTATAVSNDLGLDGSSQILTNIGEISSVAVSDAHIGATAAASIYAALTTKFSETGLVISDTGANIVAVADGADAAVLSGAPTVQLSANVVGMDAADATMLAGALHGTQSAFTVNVADNAANLLAPANAAGIALATTVGVQDTAANILAAAPELIAMGSQLVSTTITDNGPLSASAVTDLLELPGLSAGALTIADIGSQIAAAVELNGATGVAFLNAHTVELTATSTIAAADAAALVQLTSLNKEGFQINVSDSATHLTDTVDGYLAAVSNTLLISGVYLKTTGGTVTVTAATAAALTTIPHFSKNPIGGGNNNILIVQDTAAHFDSNYATLHANLGLFDHLYVSTSATVTDAVYGELLNLGAHALNGGVALTVRDSATTIAADAPGQLGGSPGITPSAWQLSGSSAVTEAQAAVLGGLAGFSAGAFTLTLSASASGVSVAAANAIGVLGSSFHLGGFSIDVSGSVATLSALTAAALAVVTPQIEDSFSNIVSGLTSASAMLSGTMQVTDSEAISVLQATQFFSLVKVGSGAGIPAANISFSGGAETITDTLANVQALTQDSASWLANTSLHSDFHLVVADTVANLINASNTTALEAMSGTTLSSTEAPVTAQALETLFTLASTINFTRGAGTVVIQDTAADLLNPTYTDAIGMATSITLLGPDTVNAAGAETLMATNKLVLTGSTVLTISDTSTDLLDGVLGPAISGGGFTNFVHVTLADNEVLDAGTAEALVSLPGYITGAYTLSIVDGASYLLNAANHTAEVDATSVTLDGDANVSAATAVALVGLQHFALDGNTLYLASNDYANAATLTTLANQGAGFNLNGNTLTMTQNASVNAAQLAAIGDFGGGLATAGHSLTLTQDALALSPDEYNALQSDNVSLAGHAWSAIPESVTVSEVSGSVQIAGTGVTNATVTLYAANDTVLTTATASPGFTVSAAESGQGINVVATETVNGTESAPIIALEQTILTGAATADSAVFAASGQVQVAGGEYMNLYTAGSQPGTLVNPVLIYDPTAHTLSYADAHQTIALVTLGAATHPASLDASEIFVKHYA